MKRVLPLLAVALLAACTKPALIIVGPRRAAINAEQVKVFLEEPKAPYELIGTVDIERTPFFTGKQGDLDRAVAAARREAAKVGANGVLILTQGRRVDGAIGFASSLGGGDSIFSAGNTRETHLLAKIIHVKAD